MKKLRVLMFIGIIFLLSGCQDTPIFGGDPELKESERIAVLEKAKTDTTLIIIGVDDKFYLVEKGVIKGVAYKEQGGGILTGFLLIAAFGFLVGILIGSSRP